MLALNFYNINAKSNKKIIALDGFDIEITEQQKI